uniref:SIX class homeobox transcription factor SIX59e n=1 Tax=Mnemiopsis leidyi TaxID=27923 RepID=E3UJW9_MNELE|nr:SIX class homeobox transcription factor SIX59e [Mnemiopsis leidyi]
MYTSIYSASTYQEITSVEDLPEPAPISPFYLAWTIPLSFNFTFPEQELPANPCTAEVSTVPVMETFTAPSDTSEYNNPDIDTCSLSPPNSPETSPTSTPTSSPNTNSTDLSDQAITAQTLYEQKEFDELVTYLSSTYFPSSDHAHLQSLYYNSLYELHMISTGKRRLEPSHKYKLRRSNPLPSTISSVKFRTNNHFDDNVKSLLLAVFKRERTPSPDTIQTLSDKTGLTERQIRNFFKNKRSRG